MLEGEAKLTKQGMGAYEQWASSTGELVLCCQISC